MPFNLQAAGANARAMSVTDADVARLEAIECDAWESLFQAAPAPFAAAVGLESVRHGPALQTLARRIDNIQFNRLWGLPDDTAAVDHAVDRFREAGLRNCLVQIAPGPHAPACERRALALGLTRFRRDWAKFRRDGRPPEIRADAHQVEEIGPDRPRSSPKPCWRASACRPSSAPGWPPCP
ncbi:MAG: hypothetical protein ACXWKM_11145, partial [Phenylobacterium sp.]